MGFCIPLLDCFEMAISGDVQGCGVGEADGSVELGILEDDYGRGP
jgi:hypothetical protein